MKRTISVSLLIMLALAAPEVVAQKSGFDFSGVDQFWKITEILEQDLEPSEEDWKNLFQTPGYRELMHRESYFNEDSFKNSFRRVFKPSEAQALGKALEKGTNRRLAHYAGIKFRRGDLKAFQERLVRGDFMKAALEKARTWLPRGTMDDEPEPPISFIFFDPDGRGYVPIIIDLAYAFDKDKTDSLVDFLAHEIHHYYRNRNTDYDEGDVRVGHAVFINSLNQLQIEGIADQIDKHERFFLAETPDDSGYAQQFRKHVEDSPRILGRVNAVLEEMADDPARIPVLASVLRGAIPQSGHPTGYFMARTIIDNGDLRLLIETVGNPFSFVYLYNKAALSTEDHPVFSPKSIEFLRSIELKYCANWYDDLWRKAAPSGLDLSGIRRFWDIAGLLAQETDPTQDDWDQLFNTPGYRELAVYEGRRFSPENLREQLSIAFRPSRKAELQAQSGSFLTPPSRHFHEAAGRRTEIDKYLDELGGGDWVRRVVADVEPFIPEKAGAQKTPPQFAPVFFSNDLRYGYAVFIFDPLYGIGRKASVDYYARLFVLKAYRDAVLSYDPQNVRQRHSDIFGLLDTLELHGFMENILSKNETYGYDPARKRERDKAYQDALDVSPEMIQKLDSTLAAIHGDPENDELWSRLTTQDFPLAGLPAGMYMARTIIEASGNSRLTETLGNPFLFVRTYHEAAGRSAGRRPGLSAEALSVIQMLEAEYSGK